MQTRDTSAEPEFYSSGEAARKLGVDITTIRRWDKAGRIRSHRTIGGQRRFRRADIDALVEQQDEAS